MIDDTPHRSGATLKKVKKNFLFVFTCELFGHDEKELNKLKLSKC